MARFGLVAAAAASILCASAQAAGSARQAANCPATSGPQVRVDAVGMASIDIDVMLYNIEGLPFPARLNRQPDLERITAELAAMRMACKAPQIVVLQEAFSQEAAAVGRRAGFAYIAHGPAADDARQAGGAPLPEAFLAGQQLSRGEGGPKLVGGGLQVLSDFPLTGSVSEPFSAAACAGTDCLSAKGAMLVRVRIPGLNVPVDVLNTHMNSRKGAGVPYARTDVAHRAQTEELAGFLRRNRDLRHPLLVAGDFNMKAATDRFQHFERLLPQTLVHRACATGACDLRQPFETAEPWMETQDLHAFEAGSTVSVRPLKLEAMFDGRNRPVLSDHVATVVTYRLSWRAAGA